MDSDARSIFIDTSASCDQLNTALTLVFVATNAGAVPVSMSLHESQTESSHTTVFMQVRDTWLSICPAVVIANFMTDNSKPMKSALATCQAASLPVPCAASLVALAV